VGEHRRNITTKKIQNYKGIKVPSTLEKNLGLCFIMFFIPFDNTIKLSNDKRSLMDKSWNGLIGPYFANSGRVI